MIRKESESQTKQNAYAISIYFIFTALLCSWTSYVSKCCVCAKLVQFQRRHDYPNEPNITSVATRTRGSDKAR